MELSDLESFHFLYRSLWNQNTDERVIRHKINIMDTIIFLQGFPVRWLFTSEKTGEVLRKKDMSSDEILRNLKSRANKLRADKNRTKYSKKGGSIFAVVWYKNEAGTMDNSRVDERQLTHLLKERMYSQAMVAVQVYFDPMPFKGSGLFEHHYNSQTEHNVGAHKTYELEETTSSCDFFEMHERIVERGVYEDFVQSQNQTHMVLKPSAEKKKRTMELIPVTETQHDLIKLSAAKIVKLMQSLVDGVIHQVTFIFCFNQNWSPFVVAAKDIIVQATTSTARILMYRGNDHADTTTSAPSTPVASPFLARGGKKMVKGFRSLKHMSSNISTKCSTSEGHSSSRRSSREGHIRKNVKNEWSDSSSDGSADYFSDTDIRNKSPGPSPAAHGYRKKPPPKEMTPDDPNFIPPLQPGIPDSSTQYHKNECTPEKKVKRREGIAARSTGLQKILMDANETKVRFTDTSEPVNTTGTQRRPNTVTISTKHYMMNTERTNQKVLAYKEDLCGKKGQQMEYRRPISAPHGVQRTSALLNFDPFALADQKDDRFRGTGVTAGATTEEPSQSGELQVKQKINRKKLLLRRDICFGDYCGLLCKFLEEWELDESLIKIKDANGKERYKSTKISHQVPTKSIHLCRAEVSYSGFDIALQENLECLGHNREDILSVCAKNHINNVSDKCRREALLPILSMAQFNAKKKMPNMKEILITAFVYRNMVYNDALSQVHPSRFYHTSPVCEVCHDIYTSLDERRAKVIYKSHPYSSNALKMAADALSTTLHTSSKEEFSDGSFQERINRARENLKKQAAKKRSKIRVGAPGSDDNGDGICDVFGDSHGEGVGVDSHVDGDDDGRGIRKSMSSSKIPWESNFMFEMNALQRGGVVAAGLSAEESVFLEETDAVADQIEYDQSISDGDHDGHQPIRKEGTNQDTSCRMQKKDTIPETAAPVPVALPLHQYQKNMTVLLNPTLGNGEDVKSAGVQRGVMASQSQKILKTSVATIAANNFSSWANLLDAANHKGKRRKPDKGFKLRTTYKNNPDAEQRRREIVESRRLDRQHEVWERGLHHRDIRLGANTQHQASATRKNKKISRPQSAGAIDTRKSNTQTRPLLQHKQQMNLQQRIDQPAREVRPRKEEIREETLPLQHYNTPPSSEGKHRHFQLENEEDVREFNDIKVDILQQRGLHSVQLKNHSTKVMCGGELTRVTLAPNHSAYSPDAGSDEEKEKEEEEEVFDPVLLQDNKDTCPPPFSHNTSTSLLHISNSTVSSSALNMEGQMRVVAPEVSSGANYSVEHISGDDDTGTVKKFVTELLKNSPMSPQNIKYDTIYSAHISSEVEKMLQEYGHEKN